MHRTVPAAICRHHGDESIDPRLTIQRQAMTLRTGHHGDGVTCRQPDRATPVLSCRCGTNRQPDRDGDHRHGPAQSGVSPSIDLERGSPGHRHERFRRPGELHGMREIVCAEEATDPLPWHRSRTVPARTRPTDTGTFARPRSAGYMMRAPCTRIVAAARLPGPSGQGADPAPAALLEHWPSRD